MKANELRFGAYVLYNNDICRFGITNKGDLILVVNPFKAYHLFNIDELQPIPLTREILEKGTVPQIFQIAYFKDKVILFHEWFQSIDNSSLTERLNNDFGKKEIKYVHELQNLIFALTGKDLDIEF